MLSLRPTCEHCNKQLPADSTDAMICSFECTFCQHCVQEVLENVCPNCGGGFAPRPIRPARNWKDGNHLGRCPATDKITHRPVDRSAHESFAKDLKHIPPAQR